jgi:alkanesulfonate monooxygenase SsuD/methylene tetrahydromethanopterin reductase-like flavin-dependent oxidoreductase (luciferase family)
MTPWAFGPDGPPLPEQAELGERLGFESFWLPESHFAGSGSTPSPLLLLAAVAARTRRIALATTSFLLPVRHPIQVAEDVAVLDRLSGGRVILGVGRGFRPALFAAFEVPPSEKRDRFEAALAVMRDAWAGRPVVRDDSGEGGPVLLAPLPLQKPHPPIWVAAFGPKALAQAGRLGLPYLASPIEPLPQLLANYAAHAAAVAAEHGPRALPVPVMRTVFAHRDTGVLARVAGALEQQAQALSRASARAIRRVGASDLEDWAIVGEPERVRDRVEHYREKLGLTHLIARAQMPGAEPRELVESLELLGGLFGSQPSADALEGA